MGSPEKDTESYNRWLAAEMGVEQALEKLERAVETYDTQVDFWTDRAEALLDQVICVAIMAATVESEA